jgi:ParB-like chromosome segregation protein Spo0J
MAANASATGQERAARAALPVKVAPDAWPANKVELWPAEKLAQHPKNPNRHPIAQLKQLDASFAEHGVARPLLINREGQIIAGNGSSMSIEHLYGKGVSIPVVVVDWDEAAQLRFMIRDNAVARLSRPDGTALGMRLAEIKGAGYSELTDLGLKPANLRKLGAIVAADGSASARRKAAPPARGRAGDAWHLGASILTIAAEASDAELAAIDAALEVFEKAGGVVALVKPDPAAPA